jgi:hypothetical protein
MRKVVPFVIRQPRISISYRKQHGPFMISQISTSVTSAVTLDGQAGGTRETAVEQRCESALDC